MDAATEGVWYQMEEKLYMEATHTSSSLFEASSWKVSSVEFRVSAPAGQYAGKPWSACIAV